MKEGSWIEEIEQLNKHTGSANLRKSARKIIRLLEEVDEKNLTREDSLKIQSGIRPSLENIQTRKDLQLILRKLRRTLTGEFGFVAPNHFLTLGIGFGVALGTALGIALGVPFTNGILFGPMIGSGTGIIGGLIAGMFLDTKKSLKIEY